MATVTPNLDYRENPARAVYVQGEVDEEMVIRLTPHVNELRLASREPITLYINSPGGDTVAAENIFRLITAPHPDGGRCRMITAVTALAASAAADLLASGDYAIAYPHAKIIYHGVRATRQSLTTEEAASLASTLKGVNEQYATGLAKSAFGRFIVRVLDFQAEFEHYRNMSGSEVTAEHLNLLVSKLGGQVSNQISKALDKTLQRMHGVDKLAKHAFHNLSRRHSDWAELTSTTALDAELLKEVISYKAKERAQAINFFPSGGVQEVIRDYELLHDFYFGDVRAEMQRLIRFYGRLLLTQDEQAEWPQLKHDEQVQGDWLTRRVKDKLFLLWYFMVSFCRTLQTEDHNMTPHDAYWVGLVDEVPGSGLWNLRTAVEASTKSL